VTAEPISEIDFSRPKHHVAPKQPTRTRKRSQPDIPDVDVAEALASLKQVLPDACALDIDDEGDPLPSTSQDYPTQDMPPVGYVILFQIFKM